MQKEITEASVIPQLLEAVPEFHPDQDDISDNLTHLVFGDLTRFVKSLAETNENDEVLRRLFSFIEEAARTTDVHVLDAVRDSFLEGLADSPDHLDRTKKYMGRMTLKLLREAQRYLNS